MKKDSKFGAMVSFRVGKYLGEGVEPEWITEEVQNLITDWGLSSLDDWWFCDMTSNALLGLDASPNKRGMMLTQSGDIVSGGPFTEEDADNKRLIMHGTGEQVRVVRFLSSSSVQVDTELTVSGQPGAVLHTEQDRLVSGRHISNVYDTVMDGAISNERIYDPITETLTITNTRSVIFPRLDNAEVFEEIGWAPENNDGANSNIFGRKTITMSFDAQDVPYVRVNLVRKIYCGESHTTDVPIKGYVGTAASKYNLADPEFGDDYYSTIGPGGETLPPVKTTILENAGSIERVIICTNSSQSISDSGRDVLGGAVMERVEPIAFETVSTFGIVDNGLVVCDSAAPGVVSYDISGNVIASGVAATGLNADPTAYILVTNGQDKHIVAEYNNTIRAATSVTPTSLNNVIIDMVADSVSGIAGSVGDEGHFIMYMSNNQFFGLGNVSSGLVASVDTGSAISAIVCSGNTILVKHVDGSYQVYNRNGDTATISESFASDFFDASMPVPLKFSYSELEYFYDPAVGRLHAFFPTSKYYEYKDVIACSGGEVRQAGEYVYSSEHQGLFSLLGGTLYKVAHITTQPKESFDIFDGVMVRINENTEGLDVKLSVIKDLPQITPPICLVNTEVSSESVVMETSGEINTMATHNDYVFSAISNPITQTCWVELYDFATATSQTWQLDNGYWDKEIANPNPSQIGYYASIALGDHFVAVSGNVVHHIWDAGSGSESLPFTNSSGYGGIAKVTEKLVLIYIDGKVRLFEIGSTTNKLIERSNVSIPAGTRDSIPRNALHYNASTNKAYLVIGTRIIEIGVDSIAESVSITNTVGATSPEVDSAIHNQILHIATDANIMLYDLKSGSLELYQTLNILATEVVSGVIGAVYKTSNNQLLEQTYVDADTGYRTHYSATAHPDSILHETDDGFAASLGNGATIHTPNELDPGVSEDIAFVNMHGFYRIGITEFNTIHLTTASVERSEEAQWSVRLTPSIATKDKVISNLVLTTKWLRV